MLKFVVIVLLIVVAVFLARYLDEQKQKTLFIGMLICAVIATAVFMAVELAR
ncbi:hypothetical protein L4174_006200 [Photobacterium sp. CCB-ST2H9]|uniref:hypothetical protein n=1 Tax=unclassified Photobacterium TaxID=2628852 RepID=UPI0020038956|nr:hypothetical protein [Photobacterium sp. CCB-ST2H9]UTM58427.1 hypothetical protein L4174_006200 [Photobacterium sp. CCB-ST2H9]